MKVIILAGGYGTRLAEETDQKPKPMVVIGSQPLLWHIMNVYSTQGFKEFIVALGYRGEMIEEYFSARNGDISADWRVQPVDTGLETGTGGRIKKLASLIGKETFMMTYGDGLANIDLEKLLRFHRSHGKLATITAVRPPARFGALELDGERVTEFVEKPQAGEGWINGGFFVLEPKIFDYISGNHIMFEKEPLAQLSCDHQLMAYKHDDFWHCVDTLRDLRLLDGLWRKGEAPWKIWNEKTLI